MSTYRVKSAKEVEREPTVLTQFTARVRPSPPLASKSTASASASASGGSGALVSVGEPVGGGVLFATRKVMSRFGMGNLVLHTISPSLASSAFLAPPSTTPEDLDEDDFILSSVTQCPSPAPVKETPHSQNVPVAEQPEQQPQSSAISPSESKDEKEKPHLQPVVQHPLLSEQPVENNEHIGEETSLWIADELCDTCHSCPTVFSTINRRHHCRICGLIFCSRCCELRQNHIRSCASCYDLHQSPPNFGPKEEPPIKLISVADHLALHQASLTTEIEDSDKDFIAQSSEHLKQIVFQLLHSTGFDLRWAEVIYQLATTAVEKIELKMSDKKYIGKYVRIKTVPGGEISDSEFRSGIGFSKNVAHKSMQSNFGCAGVILLTCPLEYSKSTEELQLASFDELLNREREYLKLMVSRIASTRPQIVVSSHVVARIALEFFLAQHMTVFSNVKLTVIKRLSRLLEADVIDALPFITDIDLGHPKPRVGNCSKIYVLKYEGDWGKKSITFFEEKPHKGGTIILRGASSLELKSIKEILQFVTYLAYNRKLERNLSLEKFSTPVFPQHPEPILSCSPELLFPPLLESPPPLKLTYAGPSPTMSVPPVTFSFQDLAVPPANDYFREIIPKGLELSAPHPIWLYQSMIVGYSVGSRVTGLQCCPWQLFQYHFYSSKQDNCLGQFLYENCFTNTNKSCPASQCGHHMLLHEQSFIHNRGRVNVVVEELANLSMTQYPAHLRKARLGIQTSDNSIFVYTICKNCNRTSPLVRMSIETYNFSFGLYLLHFFYSQAGRKPCPHGAQNAAHYYLYNKFVAIIDYVPVTVFSVEHHKTGTLFDEPSNMGVDFLRKEYAELTVLLQKVSENVDKYTKLFESALSPLADKPRSGDRDTLPILLDQLAQFERDCEQETTVLRESIQMACLTPDVTEQTKLLGIFSSRCNTWLNELRFIEEQINSLTKGFWRFVPAPVRSMLDRSKPTSTHIDSRLTNTTTNSGTKAPEPMGDSTVPFTHLSMDALLSSSSSLIAGTVETVEEQSDDEDTTLPEEHDSGHNLVPDKVQSKINREDIVPTTAVGEMHLPPGVNNLPVIVFEDEPSSIVSWAMRSVEYEEKFKGGIFDFGEFTEQQQSPEETSPSNKMKNRKSTPPGLAKLISSSKTAPGNKPVPSSQPKLSPTTLEQLLSLEKTHILIKQHYRVEGYTADFYCHVLYARQFKALRLLLWGKHCEAKEQQFLKSLTRCCKWQTQGGKKANFLKSFDDRIVLKQITSVEMHGFLSFAPSYFMYMGRVISEKLYSNMVKILGLYRVKLTASHGKTYKLDLLVMENLFFNCSINGIFDLKGARGRLISGRTGVLLDGNIIRSLHRAPLCVDVQSKFYLQACLLNDTHFLSTQDLMDYSLLVGVDMRSGRLVTGIIDYIRIYTWDKIAENKFKRVAGGGRNGGPTITAPDEYAMRYIDALRVYFTMVPSAHTVVASTTASTGTQQHNLAQRGYEPHTMAEEMLAMF
ncbi:1-phosphatidylinositol 3-phosphate 5-kinase [Pelomyxa schiedti]|nr:1-phosphatidylinositol 3-phosphate 5-kinase [Pelomyxa schiedti]